MSKELEALESIKSVLYWYYDCNSVNENTRKQEAFDIIEQALLELKTIKEAKPNKALELVYLIKDYLLNMIPYQDWLNDIEKYILKSQEQEKVLEIIKKKGYDDYLLKEFDTFEAYKENIDKFYADQLVIDWNDKKQLVELRIYTEEEFVLLKRYCDEKNL